MKEAQQIGNIIDDIMKGKRDDWAQYPRQVERH